jgi:hypothetical protein
MICGVPVEPVPVPVVPDPVEFIIPFDPVVVLPEPLLGWFG